MCLAAATSLFLMSVVNFLAQSICALLWLGEWNCLGLIKNNNIWKELASLGEIDGDKDIDLDNGWDDIIIIL